MEASTQQSVSCAGVVGQPAANRQHLIKTNQQWLLFLRHCAKCQQVEAECRFGESCRVGKELWTHILQCNDTKQCSHPRCMHSKQVLKHHQRCQVRVAGGCTQHLCIRTVFQGPSVKLTTKLCPTSRLPPFHCPTTCSPVQDLHCPMCTPVKLYVERMKLEGRQI